MQNGEDSSDISKQIDAMLGKYPQSPLPEGYVEPEPLSDEEIKALLEMRIDDGKVK